MKSELLPLILWETEIYFTGNGRLRHDFERYKMIYFGQEVGEPAAGNMGFAGDRGRTSIFRLCGAPDIRNGTIRESVTADCFLKNKRG